MHLPCRFQVAIRVRFALLYKNEVHADDVTLGLVNGPAGLHHGWDGCSILAMAEEKVRRMVRAVSEEAQKTPRSDLWISLGVLL